MVDSVAFSKRLAELTIIELLPALLRETVKTPAGAAAAKRCEEEGTASAAHAAYADHAVYYAAAHSSRAVYYAYAAADAASDASAAYAARAATSATASARAADAAASSSSDPDKYLKLSASLALRVLTELGSPGVALLAQVQHG